MDSGLSRQDSSTEKTDTVCQVSTAQDLSPHFPSKRHTDTKLYDDVPSFPRGVQVCEVYGEGLVVCEGDCSRQFHLECLGLSSPPEGRFICTECRNGKSIYSFFFFFFHPTAVNFYYLEKLMLFRSSGNHPCFSCKSAGREVTRCSVSGCGCYYHKECVRKLPGTTSSSGGGFCCPQHSCSTCCLERDVQRANKGRTASLSYCLSLAIQQARQVLFCIRKGGKQCETSKLFIKKRSSISFIDNM